MCLLCFLWFIPSLVSAQDKSQTQCAAEIEWTNCGAAQLNLFSTVSKPADACLPAEIKLTATFFDAENNMICSGVVDNVATQTTHAQSTNLEVRLFNMLEFVRWKNGPRPTAVRPKRLVCMNADGLAEIPIGELDRATSLRLDATLLPRTSGVSSAQCRLNIPNRQ